MNNENLQTACGEPVADFQFGNQSIAFCTKLSEPVRNKTAHFCNSASLFVNGKAGRR